MFSVVIPLYNKRDYIRRAVVSVLSQKYSDFELIVVDDGSVDESAEEVKSITDPRLRTYRQENLGEGAARNTGIELASREWVAFLDADDQWLPDHLEELRGLIEAYPEAGLVSGGTVELRDGDSFSEKYLNDLTRGPIDYFAVASKRSGIVNSSSCAVRRDLLRSLAGFGSARVGCDTEMWARVALVASVVISNKVTNLYHRGTGGVMERLERENAPIEVNSLAEVSAATDMLMRRIREPMPDHLKESVNMYISVQAFRLMKGALYRGQIRSAKAICKLIERHDTVPFYYRMALRAPTVVLAALMSMYRRLKSMQRWPR